MIGETILTALVGSTWVEWAASDYNTIGIEVVNNRLHIVDSADYLYLCLNDNTSVKSTDTIMTNYEYSWYDYDTRGSWVLNNVIYPTDKMKESQSTYFNIDFTTEANLYYDSIYAIKFSPSLAGWEGNWFLEYCGKLSGSDQTHEGMVYGHNSGWFDEKSPYINIIGGADLSKDEWVFWLNDNATRAASEGLAFTSNGDGTCYVSGIGTCVDIDVVIPSVSPNGDTVTRIGYDAFYKCTSLTSVVIPDSVTSIGSYAFCYCTSLTSVVIPDSVTSIANSAFYVCTSLTSVEIGDSVTSIGDSAFSGCISLIEVINKSSLNIVAGLSNYGYVGYYAKQIVANESQSAIKNVGDYIFYDDGTDIYLVKYIGNDSEITLPKYDGGKEYGIWKYAFYENDKITSVIISDSVTSIGEYAFTNCKSLASVTIGNSVTSIGWWVFEDCSLLESVTFNGTVDQWKSIYFGSGWNDGVPATYVQCTDGKVWLNISESLIFTSNGDGTCYVEGDSTKELTNIVIPPVSPDGDIVTTIAYQAFINQNELTSVIIPDSVTSIGDWAFQYSGLKSITMPNSVTRIGTGSFHRCASLTSVVLSNSLTYIGGDAFATCLSIASIVIPNSVERIRERAFKDCTSLESITFEGTVQQWNAITLGEDWNLNAPATYVQCTDGQVTL